MSDPFAAMVTTLQESSIGRDALYKAGGTGSGVTVRVITANLDDEGEAGRTIVRMDRMIIEAAVADIASPAKGDTFTLDDEVWKVGSPPSRDELRLWWHFDCARVVPTS